MSKSEHRFTIKHPPGFRRRRGLNWVSLGLMYASYYICRYSFKFATPGLKEEFGYTSTQLADIWAIWSLAYGTGQLINGLISDRIGGRRAMLIGALGTIIINFIFGFSSLVSIFSTFSMIYLVNGYFQAFGAPGMVKINAAWFQREERGTFAGIFGGMIQAGKMGIGILAPWILSGMVIAGHAFLPEGEWRWLFRIAPLFTIAAAGFLIYAVKNSPDEAGFEGVIVDEIDDSEGTTVDVGDAFRTIFTNPYVWFFAIAYASTGAVRHSSDQLSNLFFQEQLGLDMKSAIPLLVMLFFVVEPFTGFIGSFLSGWVSDKIFKGKRAPVAMFLYFTECVVISISAVLLHNGWVSPGTFGVVVACCIMLAISLTVNSTHSIVGAAAPMDIGGKKYAGFAAGVIDSFQYYGSALSLAITGRVLDRTQETHGWLFWFIIMAAFAFMGGITMFFLSQKQKRLGDLQGRNRV